MLLSTKDGEYDPTVWTLCDVVEVKPKQVHHHHQAPPPPHGRLYLRPPQTSPEQRGKASEGGGQNGP